MADTFLHYAIPALVGFALIASLKLALDHAKRKGYLVVCPHCEQMLLPFQWIGHARRTHGLWRIVR